MQVMPTTEGKQLAQKSKLAEILHSCLVAFFESEVRAWRGEARLGTVFWLHGVLASSVLIAFYVSSIYRSEALLEQALLICFGGYTIWILVSIWRCSLGADPFWGLTLVRMGAFRRQLASDISDHQRAPGFFTLVAGTCVLGTQSLVVAEARVVGTVLWWFGLGLRVVVMYGFFTAVTIRARKPSLAAGINGAWLIGAVATQSIVVLRGALDTGTAPAEPIQFIALAMFMIGSMLYLAIIPLIFYRLTFVRLTSQDFSPPYWINMGAVAISTLAGATLILRARTWPLIEPFVPFLRGFTVFFWSVATWWIPFLFALMVWRYLWKRDRLAYEPVLWGMVFPLGMYTTSTLQLSAALGWDFLRVVPRIVIYVALVAWLATMTGLTRHVFRSALAIRTRRRETG